MLENLRNNLPSGLLFALVSKMLFISPSTFDVAMASALCGVLAVQFYTDKKMKFQELKDSSDKRLLEMTNAINQQNEVIKKMAIEVDGLRNTVSTIKLHGQVKKLA